jgi:hypothetical protein
VFFCGAGENQDIIHVNHYPSFIDFILEGLVHVRLEGGRRVAQSKEHDFWLEQSKFSHERRLPSIIRVDEDIIVSPADVHFSKEFGISEFVDQRRNQWEGISILDCPFINVSIVLARSHRAVLLSNKEESAGLRGF